MYFPTLWWQETMGVLLFEAIRCTTHLCKNSHTRETIGLSRSFHLLIIFFSCTPLHSETWNMLDGACGSVLAPNVRCDDASNKLREFIKQSKNCWIATFVDNVVPNTILVRLCNLAGDHEKRWRLSDLRPFSPKNNSG